MSGALLDPFRTIQPSSSTNRAPVECVRIDLRDTGLIPTVDQYVHQHAQGSLFHLSGWNRAVADSLGHKVMYLVAQQGARVCGALPLTFIGSRFTGRRLISVPYAVEGGVLADDPECSDRLINHAAELGVELNCSYVELRSRTAAIASLPIDGRYASFRKELPARAEDVLAFLPRKARAAARNARDKFGLTVSFDSAQLPEVWQLYARNMRRLASISYPCAFFERLLAELPNKTWVSLVRSRGTPVGGLVSFLFRDTVLPYFVGFSDEARACNAANFIYLTLMERAVEFGYRVFDFGRTRFDNTGSFNFKKFHGFEPEPLEYQRLPLTGKPAPDLTPANPRIQLARRFWRHLPLSVTKSLGASLSRHFPG